MAGGVRLGRDDSVRPGRQRRGEAPDPRRVGGGGAAGIAGGVVATTSMVVWPGAMGTLVVSRYVVLAGLEIEPPLLFRAVTSRSAVFWPAATV